MTLKPRLIILPGSFPVIYYLAKCIVDKANQLGKVLKKEIQKFENLPIVSNTRCLGMIGAIELEEGNTIYKSKEIPRTEAVRRYLLDRGIFLRPLGNVVYLMMPLVVSDSLLKETIDVVCEAINSVS